MSPLELASAIEHFKNETGVPLEHIAKEFSVSKGHVRQHLNLLKLHPEIQVLVGPRNEGKKISLVTASQLSCFPKGQQQRHVKHMLKANMTTAQMQEYLVAQAKKASTRKNKRYPKPEEMRKEFDAFVHNTRNAAENWFQMERLSFASMLNDCPEEQSLLTRNQLVMLINTLITLRERL
jgi:predicted RNA-binding protein with RPS1 domain